MAKKHPSVSPRVSPRELQFAAMLEDWGFQAPVRDFRFLPSRRWRIDFAWPEQWVAVEIEGGVEMGYGHASPKRFISDAWKYNELAIRGWTLLRFTGSMLDSYPDRVKKLLIRAGVPWRER